LHNNLTGTFRVPQEVFPDPPPILLLLMRQRDAEPCTKK
jgi:hypothetical protein